MATKKISAETTLKKQVALLVQEVAALRVRVPALASGSGATRSVLFDRRGRQETSPREWRAVKWCKSVAARYGHRGVRLGDASNPGPPKRLRRIVAKSSQSTNRFEILSSDDELEVSTTVSASPRAARGVVEAAAVQGRRLVIVSQDMPPIFEGNIHRSVPSDDNPKHPHRTHQIGTPKDSVGDGTVSVGRARTVDLANLL